ncbi:MAG: polyprenyl synthetase family protein [Candidatus Omnitrophota bacterium]
MIKRLKNDIDTELKAFLKETEADFALKSSSRLLYSAITNFLVRDGKRIRPILFILSYLGYTKKRTILHKNLLRASLSFELLHDFLLIHDDIIDESDLRRGKPSMHNLLNRSLNISPKHKLGANLGIVTGDILFALATKALLSFNEKPLRKENALKMFTDITTYTGIGEFIDVLNNISNIDKISKKDINLTYSLKTSKYTFEGPLVIGGILSGAQKKEINNLSKLGCILGQAFQIQDDLLDIFGAVKKTGKPVFSDIAESKKTLLIWQTYKRALKKG